MPFAPLVIEKLMMRMAVRVRAVRDRDVLVPLHLPEVKDRLPQPIIDLEAQDMIPPFRDQPTGVERALNKFGRFHNQTGQLSESLRLDVC